MSTGRRSVWVLVLVGLLLASAIAGPVMGQATTPGPSPGGNATNNSSTAGETPYPVETLAPTSNATGNGSANGSNGSTTAAPGAPQAPEPNGSGGGIDLGVPSAGDVASEAVNGTLSTLNEVLVGTVGPILRLPWRFITVRFAPIEAAAGGDGFNAWGRPGGMFGELYDLATGSIFQIALSLLALMFLIDWFGNLSPKPGTPSAIDRLFHRGIDVLHLLFSWPIVWAHFLFSSLLAALFLPPDEVVVGGLADYYSQLAGVAGAIGFTLVFSVVLAIAGGYLLLKHGGAFVYLLVGTVAYPILVAASIPDHWLAGRIGEYAENARAGVVVAAWYPVPTAFVLGVGYTIDGVVLNTLTLGGPLGEISGGAIYYPVMWLAALYAPEKVFQGGGVARKARNAALAVGAGGAAGAATGSAAGASSGAAAGSSVVASGTAVSSASQSLPATASAAETGLSAVSSETAGATGSRVSSGSPGASALADGGTTTTGSFGGGSSASVGGGSAGPIGDSSSSAGTGTPPDGTTHVGSRSALDMQQRYEPLVQHDSGDVARVSTPKDTNWLVDRGGFDRLNQATDEPLYFRGENDGGLYDLGGTTDSDRVFGGGTGER
jgi:hypothetical protein